MDIKQALKEKIKELKTELAANEKALAALTGDAAPKGKAATTPSGGSRKPATTSSVSSVANGSPVTPGKLPDRIVEFLRVHGLHTADQIAERLVVPVGQVRTTCSRMKREGRLEAIEKQGEALKYAAHHEAKGAPPPKHLEDENPYEEAN